jgi:hypothetical protein
MVQGKWQFSPVSQNHFQDVSNLSTNGTKVLCICFFRLSDVPKKNHSAVWELLVLRF